MPLDGAERSELLRLARVAIRDALVRDGSLRRDLERAAITPAMRDHRGLFVTLKQTKAADGRRDGNGTLRGCVGTMTATRPLVDALIETAPMAALQDSRFPPLTVDELDDIRISISILTPMEPLEAIESLVPGRHGVQLSRGKQRAVFLPQVAAEQGWSAEQLLRNLALKAGLDAEAWRGAELSTFEAEVFAEGC